jgi:predicted ribosome quality control (RQC) complex YloA/Tae2 family protein
MDKQNVGSEAENMYLRTRNKRLENKIKDLEKTILELIEHNTHLGTSLIANHTNIQNQHPLEASIIFDDENNNENNNEIKKKIKKTRLQKIAHKYKKTVYILNKLSSTYTACSTVVYISKYLALLLI